MRRAIVALALLVVGGCGKSADKAPAPNAAPATSSSSSSRTVTIDPALVAAGRVRIGVAEVRVPRGESWVAGEIVAGEQSEAEVTSLASGRVASIDVALGDVVKRGQLVATVDSPEVGRASADLLRARARSTLAARALARQVDLDGQQATSKAALDEARAEDTGARADVQAARTLLVSLGGSEPSDDPTGLASTRVGLRAPIDGVITARSTMLGAPVDAQKPLFHVVAAASRIALARMPETLEATATAGTRVLVRPRLASVVDDRPCAGTVVANLGVVDDARTIPLRIALDASCPPFPSGRFVEIALPSSVDADAGALLVVPSSAITDVRGISVAFVTSGSDHAFVARPVGVGRIVGADAAIESGLVGGERVAIDGVVLLKGELLKSELQ